MSGRRARRQCTRVPASRQERTKTCRMLTLVAVPVLYVDQSHARRVPFQLQLLSTHQGGVGITTSLSFLGSSSTLLLARLKQLPHRQARGCRWRAACWRAVTRRAAVCRGAASRAGRAGGGCAWCRHARRRQRRRCSGDGCCFCCCLCHCRAPHLLASGIRKGHWHAGA